MDSKQTTAVIATFADRRPAERFLSELRRAGFKDDEIGIMSVHEESTGTKTEEGAAAGHRLADRGRAGRRSAGRLLVEAAQPPGRRVPRPDAGGPAAPGLDAQCGLGADVRHL